MATEKEWPDKRSIIEKGKDYFVVEFKTSNLPTMGAQGFIARTKDILKTTWKPYFFHLDSVFELVQMGKNKFIMADLEIEHKYVKSISGFHRKLYRNIGLFLKLKKYRKYTYDVGSIKFFIALILMMSIIHPLFVSFKGFVKKPDPAWFLHPIFCFTVPIIYTFAVLKYSFEKLWR